MVTDPFDVSADDEVLLRLHVQPGAGRSAVSGRFGDALKVRVAAPPSEGRANAAAVALVADLLGVKAAAVELVSGASSRTKKVRVKGVDPDEVRRLLQEAVAAGNAGGGPGVRPQAR